MAKRKRRDVPRPPAEVRAETPQSLFAAQTWLLALPLIFGAALWVYHNIFAGPFIFDDTRQIF